MFSFYRRIENLKQKFSLVVHIINKKLRFKNVNRAYVLQIYRVHNIVKS